MAFPYVEARDFYPELAEVGKGRASQGCLRTGRAAAHKASRGHHPVSDPDLRTQESGPASQAHTLRIPGLRFARPRVTPLTQFLTRAGELRRLRSASQHLLNSAPEHRDRAGLGQPGLATLLQKRHAGVLTVGPGEKNDPPRQPGKLLPQAEVERVPVHLGHRQVRHDDVIALGLQLGERVPPIPRRLHAVAITAQEHGQCANQARFIVNHQNGARGARCHDLPRSHRPERSASRRRAAVQRRREGYRDACDVNVEAVHAKGTWSTKLQKICQPRVDV